MMPVRIVLSVLAAATLASCASPKDTVIFVTNTSFGVNVESKPPTASIAYDRTEGYIGPRTANGRIPPVVASIQTSGEVFQPDVRTAYATGNAAVSVVSPKATPACNEQMAPGDNKMAFFGTTTSIGLKAGFDPTSGTPDSFVFGLKRKELSVIPLGNDNGTLVYPSVLASLDTTGKAASLSGTGLSIDQYFATGCAAEVLAMSNNTVRKTFDTITADAVTARLTPEQRAQALATATALSNQQNANLQTVMGKVAPGGTLDPGALSALIAKANATTPGSVNPALATGLSGAADLQSRLANDTNTTAALAQAAQAS